MQGHVKGMRFEAVTRICEFLCCGRGDMIGNEPLPTSDLRAPRSKADQSPTPPHTAN